MLINALKPVYSSPPRKTYKIEVVSLSFLENTQLEMKIFHYLKKLFMGTVSYRFTY